MPYERQVHARVFWIGTAVAAAFHAVYALGLFLNGHPVVGGLFVAAVLLLLLLAGWVRRDADRAAAGLRLLTTLLFASLSLLAFGQRDVGAPALWWLSTIPFVCLLAGLHRVGIAFAAAFIAEVLAILVLERQGRMPPVYALWAEWEIESAIAISGSTALVIACIGYSLRIAGESRGEIERARQEAVAAAETKARFMANMSHEIRTPLNGLVGAADLLRLTTLSEDQRSQLLALQQQCSKTVLTLVDDILDWSKLQAGRMTLDPQPVRLGSLVFEANQLFSVSAFDKGIELTSSSGPRLPAEVRADAARLRQIVNNLVSNAVKFTERGGVHVHVDLDAADPGPALPGQRHRVRIEVEDSGIGISEQQRARLFTAFSQGDSTITRRYGGTGLGLAICADLARLMEGRLEFETVPGQGSRFSLLLPVEVLQPAPPAPLPDDSRQVLLCCATDGLARHLEALLREAGVLAPQRCTLAEAPQLAARGGGRRRLALVDAALLGGAASGELAALGRLAGSATVAIVAPLSGDSVLGPLQRLAMLYKPVRRSSLLGLLDGALPPRADAERARVLRSSTPQPLQALGLRVLLVEDNPVNRIVVGEMLSQLSCSAVAVDNGEQALVALERSTYDVVLMDIQMPVMDGLTATRLQREREHRQRLPRVPIVAMTANAEEEIREGHRQAGMDAYLAKPFVLRQLQQCLQALAAASDG